MSVTQALPLAREIARRIETDGPMSLADYMALCLAHPEYGYYRKHDPLGRAGDFITAPEVSQMFGELLGLWGAACWLQMGRPHPVRLAELGPGRGTLMADALRAAGTVPGFLHAADLHLVETSPALRAVQSGALEAAAPTWHDAVSDIPDGPLILLANEFFDALPIRQFVRAERGWHERMIGLDRRRFVFGLSPDVLPARLVPAALSHAPPGSVWETSPASAAIAGEIGKRLARSGGTALIVDYGHADTATGDTFQAVRAHAYADSLDAPGEADLTAHVDFAVLAASACAAGAEAHGPVEQGDFLRALGIEERAAALSAAAPARGGEITAALERLTAPGAMGRLFKVLALAGPGLVPPPFAPPDEMETA